MVSFKSYDGNKRTYWRNFNITKLYDDVYRGQNIKLRQDYIHSVQIRYVAVADTQKKSSKAYTFQFHVPHLGKY